MIRRVVFCCNYVIAYLLNESSEASQWEEANIRGPAYLVQRAGAPRYQLIVQSLTSPKQIRHALHVAWDIDPHENYFLFKTENPEENVQGLWLQHDADRQRLTGAVSAALSELKSLAVDCCSEIDDMLMDANDALCCVRTTRSRSVREFGRSAKDVSAGTSLVAKAANLPRLLGRVSSKPSESCQLDAGRSSSVSPFQFKPYRHASIGSTRELRTSDDWMSRPCDTKECDSFGRLLVGRSLSMPVSYGQEGL